MNFLNSDGSLRCYSVVKFKDNIKFSLDPGSLNEELMARYTNQERDIYGLSCEVIFIDIANGTGHKENVSLVLKGMFKRHFEGMIRLPFGQPAKAFIKYDKHKAYVVCFHYNDLQPLTAERETYGR